VAVVLLDGSASSADIAGQQSTFRTDITLVRVDALVLDGSRPVAGLTRDDFTVFDEGKAQTIRHFAVEAVPLDVLLLIDKSCSMQPVVGELAVSALEALAVLRPRDRAGVMLFDTKTEVLSALSANMHEAAASLESAIHEAAIQGGTDINRGVLEAATYLRRQPKTESRRAIVILTDNKSYRSRKNSTVIRELWEADAVLNALIFQTRLENAARTYNHTVQPWMRMLSADVRQIVQETGGEALRAGAPVAALQDVLERIRNRYSLYYDAPPGTPGKLRSIRVALSGGALAKHPKATVLARRGYVSKDTAR
jgi:VWFA-related protein